MAQVSTSYRITLNFLCLNLASLLIGIGASWKKLRIAGIVPLIVYGGYLMAVSVARTSGGRYLVPIDWVVLLYYAIGIVQIIAWLTGCLVDNRHDAEQVTQYRASGREWAAGILGLILVAGMIPIVQEAIPRSIPSIDEGGLPSVEWMSAAGLDPSDVNEFLTGDGAVIRYGKAMYPRFYNWKEGESLGCYGARPYPRLVFELIGEDGMHCIILPYANLNYDVQLHSSNAIVLGCEGGEDWIVMFPDQDIALVRFTQIGVPTCPLSYPICADNRNCR